MAQKKMNDYRIYSQCYASLQKARASRRRIPNFRQHFSDLDEAIDVVNQLVKISSSQYCVLDFSPGKYGQIVYVSKAG